MYLDHIVAIYQTTTGFSALGFDPIKIMDVENRLGVIFPTIYREFLLKLACSFAPWAGSDFSPGWLPDLQGWARELLVEDGFPLPLPDDALVFRQHGGNDFDFFCFSEGDDPPTYFYDTDQTEPVFRRSADSFSTFITKDFAYYLDQQNIPIPPGLRPTSS